MLRYTFLSATLLVLAAVDASAVTINHSSIDGVALLPQSTMDAIGQQKWLFTHASVGENMLAGLNDLRTADPARYQLQIAAAYMTAPPPDPTLPGTVYEINRGNPGWSVKFSIFESLVNNDWHVPTVGFVMDKLCYIDQDADYETYVNSMSALESGNPGTTFVYTTMPLMTVEDADNVSRNDYNSKAGDYCSTNNKLLFDIADIEAYDPSGNACTFVLEGTTYQKLYTGYSSDYLTGGAHLNAAGGQPALLWVGMPQPQPASCPNPAQVTLLLTGGATLVAAGIVRRRRGL